MRIVGQAEPAPGQEPVTDVRVITRGYLEAMRIPLLSGRLFDESDKTDTTNRIVINETMARRHWPGQDPIGKRVRVSWDDREDEIIGVVGDVRHAGLETEPRAMIYWPFARSPYGTMTLTVRTASEGLNPAPAIAAIVRSLDPQLVVAGVKTMDEVVADSVAQRRLTMLLLAMFAAAALLLAAIGIYGVIAYGVTQRVREIGIRMALGAQRGAVLAMIVRQALALAAAGIVIGGAGAVLLGRVMEGLLFQIRPSDPLTFAGVSGLLAAVALLASYIPGRRATRIDPVIALRSE
jgi:putative ABC transport system permease protein